MQKIIRVFEDDNKCLGRYTVVIDGAVYSMATNADRPQGYCKHLGLCVQNDDVMRALQGHYVRGVGREIELVDAPKAIRVATGRLIK